MQFGGRYVFSVNRDAVWAALNDAPTLQAAIPGCSRLDWTGPSTLECEIKVNFGLVQPSFTGDLELRDVTPASRYTLAGRGRGGLLGKAEAAADITLSDVAGGTELRFTAGGSADGGIMKFGKALIGNSAQKVIDGFFERFAEAMGVKLEVLPVD